MTSGNVAAVDIGTNSVRLLITDALGRELERQMQITRLGQGVDVSGSLHPDAIARTLLVLARYGTLIADHAVGRIRAVATSAARDADNSRVFLDAAERALDARPELLTGKEEALFSFRGATLQLDPGAGPFLVIDLGGGSTEFVLGITEPSALASLNIGCVRMSERHLKSDPPTHEQLEACFADVRSSLARVRQELDPQEARTTIGLAGTVTTLASLQQGLLHYDPKQTHHSLLSRDQIEALFARLASVSVEQRRLLLAEPQRAEVIVGGAAVLLTIMREFAIDELLVSESDILDGLAAALR